MKTVRVLFSLLFAGVAAHAQLLTSYEFTGATTLPVPATTTAAGITASGITKSPDILNVVPNANLLSVSPGNSANTPTNAVTLGQYFEFTVRPEPGGKLNLGALIFQVRRETNDALGWVVRSSVDNFTANLGTADIPTVSPTFTSVGVILPSAQFSGSTAAVTFRIYTYWTTALLTFADYDSIQLIGSYTSPNKAPEVGVFSSKKLTTTRKKIRLSGNAFDDVGVQLVQVGSRTATGTTSWKATVPLKRGLNRIRVIAIDGNGAASPAVTIRVKRTS